MPNPPRLFLMEDDPSLRTILEMALRDRYDLKLVSRGDVALGAVEQFKPSLVILDIHVPGKNGFEVCEQIKNAPALRHIPVMLLTSRSDQWSRSLGERMRADYYVTKPFDLPLLLKQIDLITRKV